MITFDGERRADRWPKVAPVESESWREALTDPTVADAVCDRLVHNVHVLKLGGPSIRRKKALEPQAQPV